MTKIVKFEDFKKEEEKVELQDLKRNFTKNSVDTQKFPRNTKFHYNDVTKKMDDLSVDEVDDSIESLEESNRSDLTAHQIVINNLKMYDLENVANDDNLKTELAREIVNDLVNAGLMR
jgi:hypothetical protein